MIFSRVWDKDPLSMFVYIVCINEETGKEYIWGSMRKELFRAIYDHYRP